MNVPDFFSEVALDLHQQPTTEKTVDLITEYAKTAADCNDAGIMLVHSRARIETAASTSSRVARSHELQFELDEGPCLDAIESGGSFLSSDVENDDRWPQWGPSVAELGIHSAMSVLLETRERRYGSLNLYANRRNAFDGNDLATAMIFARHASVALANAHQEAGLLTAIDARKVIGQAQGILMERFDIEADRAFDVLRRYSQNHNQKLHSVANWVVENRKLPVTDFPHTVKVELPAMPNGDIQTI
ncbi:GAF and ANTAR domain-containing protein [Aeromicrobium duanguangcaii]|uniref:GAF and ANTAR domain-containing protein n=1 Tax=Aeromicrobium duanguangcaii TaxID=2968086 RepID=A0ABY5KDZ9_9ACTN|nr:GAF and ANTAR domain-containing protein [Aeromicrobium duanguangcaii]MCD9154247.1 GAF and ANTAR domain-containing protein [Aeromicrobium duanguangcaii]UUI68682.1 GAF and ANTAR domain-containing protein [Aeromicrobium duanguangcaii]